MRFHSVPSTLPIFILFCATVLLAGCAQVPALFRDVTPPGPAHSLEITTTDQVRFLFHRDAWSLNLRGIAGTADRMDVTGAVTAVDTVLEYSTISNAAATSGRGSTMEQFLLTVLGVILVIGLAGLMLYAAFRATER